jgi:neutral ceramidase
MSFTAGVARTTITPFWGVELAGWGYYIERRWQRIADDLHATALVVDDGRHTAAIIALDLMVIDDRFTGATRKRISAATGIPEQSILLTCSHSHNAPAAGGLRGVGECDPAYEDWASRQAATAAILAWRNRAPARAAIAHGDLAGLAYNRTRAGGPVDTRLTTLRLDRDDGSPLAMVVNFQAHPCVYSILRPFDVTRDVPGEVCDLLEAALPGATALYIQGACGDVNFDPAFSTAELCHEPASRIAAAALDCQSRAVDLADPPVGAVAMATRIPTRRWTREEIDADRDEAEHRLATGDVAGWRAGIGRVMTNRPDDMIARHGGDEAKAVRAMARFNVEWTEQMLADYETRPEWLDTEVQSVSIGELSIVANASEFFTTLALDVRARSPASELMIACYANGRIGYMPDAHDVERRTYAAYQSPKYCNQFPFTAESGPAMCEGMLQAIEGSRAEARLSKPRAV